MLFLKKCLKKNAKGVVKSLELCYYVFLVEGKIKYAPIWRGGRVVEGAALEMLFGGNLNEGSNPSLSVSTINVLDVAVRDIAIGQASRLSSKIAPSRNKALIFG